jgi:hypothetical protein
MDLIDSTTFWRVMKTRGWEQDDIDRWCEMDGAPTMVGARHKQPMIDAGALMGLRVKFDRAIDAPCAMSGHTAVKVGQGAGPHAASLRCVGCDRHRGWLPKAVADFLLELITRFGRPSEAITIRNSEIRASGRAFGCKRDRNVRHPEPEMKGN